MTKLDKLLHSLTDIIVCYHDIKTHKLPFNEKGFDLISNEQKNRSITLLTEANYSEELEYLISSSTSHFPDRAQLLTYLVNEISLLKNIKEQQPTVEELNEQIKRLLTNLKCLIATSQEEKCTIRIAENLKITECILPGLKRTPSLVGHVFFWIMDTNPTMGSASFALIKKVLETFSITDSSSELKIKEIAKDITHNYTSPMKMPIHKKPTEDVLLDQKTSDISTSSEISTPTDRPVNDNVNINEDLSTIIQDSQPTYSLEKKSISSLLAFSMHGGHPLLMHIMEQHLNPSINEDTLQAKNRTI